MTDAMIASLITKLQQKTMYVLAEEKARLKAIHRKEKDGDCFAHENSKRAYKNTKKNCKSFKLDKSNAVSVEMTTIKPYISISLVGLVWFARYCGKMYSHSLFSYGRLWLSPTYPLRG